jgi:hypothetical protein
LITRKYLSCRREAPQTVPAEMMKEKQGVSAMLVNVILIRKYTDIAFIKVSK